MSVSQYDQALQRKEQQLVAALEQIEALRGKLDDLRSEVQMAHAVLDAYNVPQHQTLPARMIAARVEWKGKK